ncbi:phosphoserine aminotransferase [Hypnocyclicus thermotrophus]|uniref:phosphoserine transaminase n=1 Tax=Hypnocyclicus thermotrophus TaxID=1627895 RepID=A0AA46DZ23_9FUSO|nr:phosphoserine transaminase [Hypnocyclicus thermotrophus]TDT71374.1 phosphoserine aminotransferase [Hypnocyclicus thermotrophus]
MKPKLKPNNTHFSSGPCSKFKGYRLNLLSNAPLGRSHRSKIGKAKLQESIEKTKKILQIPDDYRVGIVPASDTGAIEMALWNVLGERGVEVIAFDAFGREWANDIKAELKLSNVTYHFADYGHLPDLSNVDCDNDIVFTWNGTTSGVKVPNADWIDKNRKGLTICDATSAVFAMEIPWEKLDIITFSWQKVLGGEGAHGMLILSPRAVKRIENYTPDRALPKIFRLKKNGKLIEGIFKGSTINTPSMLCNEDYLVALNWIESIGGIYSAIKKSEENLSVIEKFVEENDFISFLPISKEIRSNTSVCLKLDLESEKIDKLLQLLLENNIAYDIASYRDSPKGIRIWCGATIEKDDLEILCEWIKWAYKKVK